MTSHFWLTPSKLVRQKAETQKGRRMLIGYALVLAQRLHCVLEMMRYIEYRYTIFDMVGQKNRTCLSVDNSAMVSGRKTCNTSKVSECCKE